jgi:translation initiation factor 2 beta subunit (eIF-2beta)/eIF-5
MQSQGAIMAKTKKEYEDEALERKYAIKRYRLDRAMKLAQMRSEIQPKLISMTSKLKYWNNDSDKQT